MELTDLNLDVIDHICSQLNIIDLTMLSRTCSSLRMLYPDVEVKQYYRMLKVIADINKIKYTININDNITKSVRTVGDISIEYTKYHFNPITIIKEDDDGLYITYKFASDKTREKDECIFDGGFPDTDKYRRFRTKIDRKMWYVDYDAYDGERLYLYRRRFPTAVSVCVTLSDDNTQRIYVADGKPCIETSGIKAKDYPNINDDNEQPLYILSYLPQWADSPQ